MIAFLKRVPGRQRRGCSQGGSPGGGCLAPGHRTSVGGSWGYGSPNIPHTWHLPASQWEGRGQWSSCGQWSGGKVTHLDFRSKAREL